MIGKYQLDGDEGYSLGRDRLYMHGFKPHFKHTTEQIQRHYKFC